jgi:hypothetical protein
MTNVQEIVSKLDSPVLEIRLRALDNITDKIKFNLININDDLVDSTRICSILVSKFAEKVHFDGVKSKSVFPEAAKILDIFHIFIEKSTNGRSALVSLNTGPILQAWKGVYESFQDPSLLQILNKVLENLEITSENQFISSYGAAAGHKSVLDQASSTRSDSPGEFLNHQTSSLAPHLLAARDKHACRRMYSPVTRSYLKKVTFDEAEVTENDEEDSDDQQLRMMNSNFQWHPISRPDRFKLEAIHSGLISHKPEVIRDVCIELQSTIFEDFPAEIFLQRPDIIFALQDVLLVNSNQALTSGAADAMTRLADKLSNRLELCSKVKSGRKDSMLLLTTTVVSEENNQDDEQAFDFDEVKKRTRATADFVKKGARATADFVNKSALATAANRQQVINCEVVVIITKWQVTFHTKTHALQLNL